MATLIIDTGTGSELDFEIGSRGVSIGASADNDVVLRAPGVAPHHLVIRRSGDRYTFLAQQRQVVLVNGTRRARGVLDDGDRIRVGTATLSLRDTAPDDQADETVVTEDDGEVRTAQNADGEASRPRADMLVFREPARLSEARRQLLETFRESATAETRHRLESSLESAFEGRRCVLAWLDPQGELQPIIASGRGEVPQVPERTFAELDRGNRIALLRIADQQVLVYPVPGSAPAKRIYLLVVTDEDLYEEDRAVAAEVIGMLAARWQEIADSSAILGQWEEAARAKVEARIPGTSAAVRTLRDEVLAAARSAHPVLLYGPQGSGRAFLGSLIAALRPTGRPWIRIVQVRGDDDSRVAAELFGSETTVGARSLAEHAGGGVVVVREVQRMSPGLQDQTATAMANDLGAGYGARVRWILTAEAAGIEDPEIPAIATTILDITKHHMVRVPSLEERREDLPLLIVRLLDVVAAEQGKEIAGIDLSTLDSLLTHGYGGQMSELLGELRRLVSATRTGDTIRGSVRGEPAFEGAGEVVPHDGDVEAVKVLHEDDLKVVIPAVERMLIDRVLRRARGNQSKAARELNLSRGALISKIKEYDIPDYRALRRREG